MLKAIHVTKKFGELVAVDALSFHVRDGQIKVASAHAGWAGWGQDVRVWLIVATACLWDLRVVFLLPGH
jgi:ABC-type Na+ transport system ATPase subunit NatA